MRTNLKRIQFAIRKRIALHGNPVKLTWTEFEGVTSVDRVTGAMTGAIVEKAKSTRAFVHFISPATSGVRVFAEIAIGDAILDFDPDEELDGKDGLTFEFADAKWAQKEVGEILLKSWDTLFGGLFVGRTVLVTRKK